MEMAGRGNAGGLSIFHLWYVSTNSYVGRTYIPTSNIPLHNLLDSSICTLPQDPGTLSPRRIGTCVPGIFQYSGGELRRNT